MRLIEPLGLISGPSAEDAVKSGLALRLTGGPSAFTLVSLLENGTSSLHPVSAIPAGWEQELARITAVPPPWAGLPPGPLVMGILNITPDSFSDGGRHFDPGRAIAAGQAMIAEGAGMLDIGGESTRPGESVPVPPEEECARILPVIRGLRDAGVPLSIDTRNARTMTAALEEGAHVINDVSGLLHDRDSAAVVARAGCPVVLMHMRGTPQTMQSLAHYADPTLDVTLELADRLNEALAAGIARGSICLDPGIGFAKTATQSRAIIARLALLLNLGCPVLLGVSRKSMVGRLAGAETPIARLPGSLAAALYGLERGASILRVHDVPETVQAVRVWQAMTG